LLGAIFFLLCFGWQVVDLTNTTWLLTNGDDLSQHQAGWMFYRSSGWSFPFGIIQNLAYPFGVPITFTDSIPLFAIIFKMMSGILPAEFQYFGLFTLIGYFLQGGIGALIIRRFTKSNMVALVGPVFFVISPVMLTRVFRHTALSAN
jgi:hypothetical protein